VRFTAAGNPPQLANALPEGEYDVVVALRLAVLTETLAALYEGMRYPREISEGVDSLFSRERLEALSDDVPAARIGPLRLTAPLRVSAVTGTENLLVVQEFALDLRRTVSSGPFATQEITVSSLHATAQFGVAVRAAVDLRGDLVLRLADLVFPVTDAVRLRLTIAADSPIQPRSAGALDVFTAEIDPLLRLFVNIAVTDAVDSVSPVISLPGGTGIDLTVADIGVRTHRADDGDVIVVGVRLSTDALPEERPGDPETLGNPFGATTLNTYARFHEAVFRKFVKEAHASGALQKAAREVHDDLRVDGADAQLDADELKLILDVRVVDACPLNKDLSARVTLTYRFSIFQGQLFATRTTDTNLDNTDVLACLVSGALTLQVLGAVVLVVDLIWRVARFASLLFDDGDEEPFEILSVVFDPGVPVPGTEVLPRAELVQALVREDRIESSGMLSLRPDDVNTYIYAQFARRSPKIGGPPTPIADAQVQLVDQDRPAPPGDDATIPAIDTTTSHAGDTITARTVEFEAPVRDQVLASDTTDSLGRVQFVLRPGQLRTTAGTMITTDTTVNIKEVR
jgi:hypothetical protein